MNGQWNGGGEDATGGGSRNRRRGTTRVLGALVPALAKRALGKRGFTTAALLTDWSKIVGPELARQSRPERLAFPRGRRDEGVLHIRVDGPLATELMHLEPQVVERINGHFGYRAVARLRLIQAPVARTESDRREAERRRAAARPKPQPEPEDVDALEDRLATIEDPELRASLKRLGTAILRRKMATKTGE